MSSFFDTQHLNSFEYWRSVKDTRKCRNYHESGVQGSVTRKPVYDGIDLTGVPKLINSILMMKLEPLD